RFSRDWSSDVCSSDLDRVPIGLEDLRPPGCIAQLAPGDPGEAVSGLHGVRAGCRIAGSGAVRSGARAGTLYVREIRAWRLRSWRSEERRVGREGRTRG